MWRELLRTIVSAFKMFTRIYWRWLGFAVLFMFFFRLLGYIAGALLILPFSPLFGQWEFNFNNLSYISNIWWLRQLVSSGGESVIFAVGMLGAYIGGNPQRVSFGDFIRSIPVRAWRLFFSLFIIFNLINYGAEISGQYNDIPLWKWTGVILDYLPTLTIYMGAALVYMRAVRIPWSREYWKRPVIYQIADMAITYTMAIIVILLFRLLMMLNLIPADVETNTWSLFFWQFGTNLVEHIFTIIFYGCLMHAVFYVAKEDIELELETGSGLLVAKH